MQPDDRYSNRQRKDDQTKSNQIRPKLPVHCHTMAMQYADVEKRTHKKIEQEAQHESLSYVG
jgi:hypothetical protein